MKERGIGKARNYGANHASGDVIIFINGDVRLPVGFADTVSETFKETEVVGATCCIMPEQGRFAENVFLRIYNALIEITTKIIPHSRGEFLVARKTDFVRVGGFDESLPSQEDNDLAYRLSRLGKFVFINNLTVYESMRRFRKMGFAMDNRLCLQNTQGKTFVKSLATCKMKNALPCPDIACALAKTQTDRSQFSYYYFSPPAGPQIAKKWG